MRDDPDTRVARDKRNPRDVAIGYYAHHHGQGHLTRALTIASRLPCPMTLFSSIDSPADMPPSVTAYTLPPDTEARLHTGRHAESDAASDKLPSTPLDAVNAPLKTLSGALPGRFTMRLWRCRELHGAWRRWSTGFETPGLACW